MCQYIMGAVELRNTLTALPSLVNSRLGSGGVSDAIPATVVFDFPTVAALSAHLARCAGFVVEHIAPPGSDQESAEAIKNMLNSDRGIARRVVAIGHLTSALPGNVGVKTSASDALGTIPGGGWILVSLQWRFQARGVFLFPCRMKVPDLLLIQTLTAHLPTQLTVPISDITVPVSDMCLSSSMLSSNGYL